MTRKDYKLVANAIKDRVTANSHHDGTLIVLETLAINLCDAMKRDNPNFNRDKFLEACGF